MKYHFSFLPFLKILHLSGTNALIIAITQNNQYNNNTAYGNQYNGASQRNNNPTPAQNSEPQQPTYGNQPYQQDDNQPIDENFLNDFTGYNFY